MLMINQNKRYDFRDALKVPNIRLFIGSVGFFTLASRALAVVIGFQIYKLTHNPLSLGWLGLVEAIPAISIAPFGGYVADHSGSFVPAFAALAVLVGLVLAAGLMMKPPHRAGA